ncbi:hypothetical protein ACWOFR_03975 [Carnobacterium gallinarum]|uniref:hypothetical protein n=1 Tax=Carnobacterium gallinarum TaxID=2749 RepID=UPI000553EC20|nr:hypothetical protein [Carnobacterium gallinarum]
MNANEALHYLMERTKQWPEMIVFVNWGMEESTRETTLVAAYSGKITKKSDFSTSPVYTGIPGTFFALTEKVFTKKGLNHWLEQIRLEETDDEGTY